MQNRRASAPGKLVLFGEFAVFDGAPLGVVPAPARCLAELGRGEGGAACCCVLHAGELLELRGDPAVLEQWPPLVAAVLATCLPSPALRSELLCGQRLSVDTRTFYRDGVKLGLGSSAAVAAALSALLSRDKASVAGLERHFALAWQAHRRWQGGLGSGADVACACWREPLLVRTRDVEQPPALARLRWPSGLAAVALWTAAPVTTAGVLRRFRAYRQQCRPQEALGATAEAVAASFAAADARAAVRSIALFDEAFRALGRDAGIVFHNATHCRIAAEAARFGLVAKPSGAGGDVSLLFGDEPEALEAFLARHPAYRAQRLHRFGAVLSP